MLTSRTPLAAARTGPAASWGALAFGGAFRLRLPGLVLPLPALGLPAFLAAISLPLRGCRESSQERSNDIPALNGVEIQRLESGVNFGGRGRGGRSGRCRRVGCRFAGWGCVVQDESAPLANMKLGSVVPHDVPALGETDHDGLCARRTLVHVVDFDDGLLPAGIVLAGLCQRPRGGCPSRSRLGRLPD